MLFRVHPRFPPNLMRGVLLLTFLLGTVATIPQPTLAASSVSVTAWTCPAGQSTTDLDAAALLAACPEASEGTTFALTTGGLTRRRVTGPDKPAIWPAVSGDYRIEIGAPDTGPALVICDQNGISNRFDAPDGSINGTLTSDGNLTCNWFRLPAAAPEPSPTAQPTSAPVAATSPPAVTPDATSEVSSTPDSSGDPASGDFEGLIDIGGRSLYLDCTGTGALTILFEAGGPGGSSTRWDTIIPNITADFRACRYDRASLGQSDPPADGTRTVQDSVNDLRALITSAPLACPCVFVGESWGANIVRLYAGQYPATIAGMVLIDPIAPGFLDDFMAIVSSEAPGYSTLMGSDNPERMDQMASLRQADTATIPPPVPTIVIGHGLNLGFPISYPVDQLEASWRTRQETLAADLNAGHVIATLSSNSIVNDQPELVLQAVTDVIDAAANPAEARSTAVVHRIDGTGKPLTGSCFQIYLDAGGGTPGDYRGAACDADVDGLENGVINLIGLDPGDYVLQEVSPPTGIEPAPDQTITVIGTASHITIKTVTVDPETGSVIVTMAELNGSGISGKATMTANGRLTDILVEVTGATGNHPIHVHFGSCEQLGEVAFPLENIGADGRSQTTVDISLEDLLAGDYAINAHQSEEDIVSYVACGKVTA